ncbi:MAG: hypothetical protein OXM55_02975 [Bdellovibrionales bacterium]|nr:hypothetical protein [Bdellovibrionales bacterium]
MKKVLGLLITFSAIFVQQSYGTTDGTEPGQAESVQIEEGAQAEKDAQLSSIEQWLVNQDIIQMYSTASEGEMPLEPWDMQADLKARGVTVLLSSIGYDGLRYALEDREDVNAPTINVVSIPVEFYEQVKELGFRLCKELQEEGGECHALSYTELMTGKSPFTTSIYKSAEQKQCHPGSGVTVQAMEHELMEAEIMVYQRYRAYNGMRRDFSCRENTADINVYIIEMSRLAEAMSMGYRECAWLEMIGGGACHPLPKN